MNQNTIMFTREKFGIIYKVGYYPEDPYPTYYT